MVKQREVSDLAPFCFVMEIYACRKTRQAIFGVSFCFKMPEQGDQILMFDVLSENMTEGLIMTVLKENNIELSENDLKQG